MKDASTEVEEINEASRVSEETGAGAVEASEPGVSGIAEIPEEWPALMTTNLMSEMRLPKTKTSMVLYLLRGKHVKTVVSFPGIYKEDWNCLVTRSIKRTGFEMDSEAVDMTVLTTRLGALAAFFCLDAASSMAATP